MESLLPLLLIFAVMMLPMLFLSNRQKKTQQKQRELVSQLGVGDEVRTHSGFYGLIVDSFDDVVILESENGAQTKWARQAIASAVEPADGAEGDSLTPDDEFENTDSTDSTDSTRNDLSAGGSTSDQSVIPGVTVSDPSAEDRRDR